MQHNTNPFGISITTQDIIDTIGFLDSWEERYKYIIDLGKDLLPMAEEKKTDDKLVRGCQSQVWMDYHIDDGIFYFDVDSDAFIVKGLLGVVLAAYNGKRSSEILDFDIDAYFDELALLKHLSPTRGNGIRAMVQRVKDTVTGLN